MRHLDNENRLRKSYQNEWKPPAIMDNDELGSDHSGFDALTLVCQVCLTGSSCPSLERAIVEHDTGYPLAIHSFKAVLFKLR